jgi:sugar lactone lactonase YvrE
MAFQNCVGLLLGLGLLGMSRPAWAQQPQDNWYLEQTWTKTGGSYAATNGGLSSPYGVGIGPDGRIYVGDAGYGQIQVYLPDGTYSFSITNGFGGGQTFSLPRGMITDKNGNLYVADLGNNCVYEFAANGVYLRKFGSGLGSGNGQLSGVIDVGVSITGEVYVLEAGNSRVSVFDQNGMFVRKWGGAGTLDGLLINPTSLAVSPDQKVYVCQTPGGLNTDYDYVKIFDKSGVFLNKWNFHEEVGTGGVTRNLFGPSSVRVDPSGLIHVIQSYYANSYRTDLYGNNARHSSACYVLQSDGSTVVSYSFSFGNQYQDICTWPCHSVGSEGSMVVVGRWTQNIFFFRHAFREQWAPPRNAIPMPTIIAKQQRASSPFVDIDYQVTDADDTNVSVAILIFTNSSSVTALGSCLRNPTLVEGTATNLGPGILANQPHRLTWNAGADWSVNLGNYRVAILARDSRTNLLDIHYLRLPAGNGMPALKLSRGPLNTDDFMQVWWWLLASGEPGITLSSNQIFGGSGAFLNKQLYTNGLTTADGRSYLYAKMNVREATTPEVQWARQGNMPAGDSPNQWAPARQVGGRPKAVNEWGFDTGSWDTNTCKWVVPLN